ncbi:MAG TPA: hypothetical protein VHD56_03765 [Tepidisphaeraceae bacterium]|nr:hypothetical protein [Tepidisphaeraceae bacterium]
MRQAVIQGFEDTHDGFSADFVMADPDANLRYRARVRELGINATDLELNLALVGARKRGDFKHRPTTREFRISHEVRSWLFAAEWAVRHLQRLILAEINRLLTLDTLLCDPAMATRFDEIAARIKPGFRPIEYRWSALALRKSGSFQLSPRWVAPPEKQLNLFELVLDAVPSGPGVYVIRRQSNPIYVNTTSNLRQQLKRHLEIGERLLIPDWLCIQKPDAIAYTYMPGATRDGLLEERAREIAELRPWLNLLDTAGAA